MWGHDFRPDYLFIRRALAALGDPSVLGMTATATPATARGDRRRARPRARGRADERRPPEPPLRRRGGERQRGSPARPRRPARAARGRAARSSTPARATRASASRARSAATDCAWSTTTPASTPTSGRASRTISSPAGSRASSRRRRSAWGSTRRRPVRLPRSTIPTRSRATCRWSVARGRGRRTERDAAAREPVRRDRGAPVRGRPTFPSPTICARSTGRFATAAASSNRNGWRPHSAGDHDPRVLVGMLEQAGIVRRGYDAGRAMRIELLESAPAPGRSRSTICSRVMRARQRRAWSGSSLCREHRIAVTPRSPSTSARRFTAPCGACDVCDPPDELPATAARRAAPGDVAGTIVSRRRGARRGRIGRRSLVAMLRGSVAAPRRRARSLSYGDPRGRASDAEVKRWVKALEDTGALLEVGDEGRLQGAPGGARRRPTVTRSTERPDPTDESVVERLRSWRLERSRADEVPAYVVLHDATLRELAAAQPSSMRELAAVKGFGPGEARALRRRCSRNPHTAVTRHADTIPRLRLRRSTEGTASAGAGFASCASSRCSPCWCCSRGRRSHSVWFAPSRARSRHSIQQRQQRRTGRRRHLRLERPLSECSRCSAATRAGCC